MFQEQDLYDQFLDIYPFPTLVKLKYFIGGIQYFVTVVGRWIVYSNILLMIPFTHDLYTIIELMMKK